MTTDTIKTPFPATVNGECQLHDALGSLTRFVEDEDVIVLDDAAGPVLGIVVQDPDVFSLADRIAAVVKGTRLGTDPRHPPH